MRTFSLAASLLRLEKPEFSPISIVLRHFMIANIDVVCRMNVSEKKQIATDAKVDGILERLDSSETPASSLLGLGGQRWQRKTLHLGARAYWGRITAP